MAKNNQRKSAKHFAIEKTKRNVFIIVVLASMIVSTSLVLGKFIWDWSAFNASVLSAQSDAKDNLELNIERAGQIVNEYQAFAGTSEVEPKQILDALPAEYDFSAWNSSLQFIVGLNSLSLQQLSGDDLSLEAVQSSTEPEPVSFTFGVEAEGSYGDVQSFVVDLKRSIRPISVQQMTLSGDGSNMTIEIDGQTYYQPGQSLEFDDKEVR